eukprot:GILK01005228.1.p1 GENE.GILK01005228.1~~GILK01005228.1.p1  ORF type:complete len:298 (-),score=35.51 GILK01005228.1:246-1139(-)
MQLIESIEQSNEILDRYDNFLFDCDGVIWEGNMVLPGAKEALDLIRNRGKRIFFVTNNSTKTRDDYVKKFAKLGLVAHKEEIYGSADFTASYLRHHHPNVRKAYVFGEESLMQCMRDHGITPVGGPADADKPVPDEAAFLEMKTDPEIGAVVVGFDSTMNYYKLSYAALCTQENPSCVFVATNRDPFLAIGGRRKPGTNTMVAAVENVVGRSPVVCGKPSAWVVQSIVEDNGLDKRRTCMVGDRMDTDILMGMQGGIDTILVLTGVTSLDEVRAQDRIVPTYIASHLGRLGGHSTDS